MIPSSWLLVIGSVLLTLAGNGWVYVDHLRDRVADLTVERDEAIADRQAAEKALVASAAERAAADIRAGVARTAREEILALPETDDGFDVLLRALDAAEQIGGEE